MQGLEAGDLKIDVDETDPQRLKLHWKGASNSRDPASLLRAFFEVVIAEAARRSAAIELHFEKLSHFNSATVAALLRIIERVESKKLMLALYYDGSQRWQAHNFEAISLMRSPNDKLEVHRVGEAAAPEVVRRP
jgi:hypothetical protein